MIQTRNAFDLGGLYWSANLILSQASAVACRYVRAFRVLSAGDIEHEAEACGWPGCGRGGPGPVAHARHAHELVVGGL